MVLRMNGVGLRSFLSGIKNHLVNVRSLHTIPLKVHHNPKRHLFYVILDDYNKRASLYYILENRIMYIRGISVPKEFSGQGIARLLTETAITYAVLKNYFLFLTCTYAQKYYLSNKNTGLTRRIIGPKHILDMDVSLDLEHFDEIPDPDDPPPKKN